MEMEDPVPWVVGLPLDDKIGVGPDVHGVLVGGIHQI